MVVWGHDADKVDHRQDDILDENKSIFRERGLYQQRRSIEVTPTGVRVFDLAHPMSWSMLVTPRRRLYSNPSGNRR